MFHHHWFAINSGNLHWEMKEKTLSIRWVDILNRDYESSKMQWILNLSVNRVKCDWGDLFISEVLIVRIRKQNLKKNIQQIYVISTVYSDHCFSEKKKKYLQCGGINLSSDCKIKKPCITTRYIYIWSYEWVIQLCPYLLTMIFPLTLSSLYLFKLA